MVTYGTTAIPSDEITVLSGGTVAVSVAFDNSIGLMGGMDTGNGTANTGEVTKVSSPSDAQTKFGDGSELHEAAQIAFQQGVGTMWALPVDETTVSNETQTTQSGSLDNAPVFDPRVNEEHSLTATDTGTGDADVNLVDEPPTSSPSTTDQIDVYPPTGEYYADATPDGDYEFTYDYGTYDSAAMTPLLDKSPRIVAVLTENESVTNTLATELNSRAVDFDFMHGVTNAQVSVTPSSYSDGVDERRISMVYPARAYTDDAETNEERTASAVGGYLASLPLGLSSTNDGVGGFISLKNPLSGPSEAGTMRDNGVMPLLNYSGGQGITVVQDMTTSTEPKFERVYAMQVIDEMTEISHLISREFVGEQNTEANRQALRRSHENSYIGAENGSPPLLDDFTVTVQENASDPNQVDVEIGLDVVDVMDTVSVTITVGNIVRNGGSS